MMTDYYYKLSFSHYYRLIVLFVTSIMRCDMVLKLLIMDLKISTLFLLLITFPRTAWREKWSLSFFSPFTSILFFSFSLPFIFSSQRRFIFSIILSSDYYYCYYFQYKIVLLFWLLFLWFQSSIAIFFFFTSILTFPTLSRWIRSFFILYTYICFYCFGQTFNCPPFNLCCWPFWFIAQFFLLVHALLFNVWPLINDSEHLQLQKAFCVSVNIQGKSTNGKCSQWKMSSFH